MNNYKHLPIMYISAEHLFQNFKDEKSFDYANVGIIADARKLPIARLMYTHSSVELGGTSKVSVKKDSYSKDRKVVFEWFVESVVNEFITTGKKASYLYTYLATTLIFLSWLRDNDKEFPSSIKEAKLIFEQYTLYLKSCVRASKFKSNRAQVIQSIALKLLRYVTNDEANYISLNITLFSAKFNHSGTVASNQEDSKKAFKFYLTLFREISDFLLKEKSFPMENNLLGEKFYVLPIVHLKWLKIEKDMPNDKWKTIKANHQGKLEHIKKALSEPDKEARLQLASIGLQAYYMCFLSISGMNASVSGGLKWKSDYDLKKTTYFFRGIKARAKNKVVEFNIEKKFSKDFNLFTKLRAFALDGHENKYLFFSGYSNKIKKQTPLLNGSKPRKINKFMQTKISSKLPMINARQMRVNKTKHLLQTKGIKVASVMTQSSMQTIAKHYTGESDETSSIQVTNFFNKLNTNVFSESKNVTDTSIGRCRKKFKPSSEVKLRGIKIDCSQPEGCLFCEHYCFVPDETDIRKLHSALYVINESKTITREEKQFEDIFNPVILRIKEILSISSKQVPSSKELIKNIEKDVFENENLHVYWERKLELLIDLGVLR